MKNIRTILRITRWVSVAALTLLCLTPSAVLGQSAKTDFSGTWVKNVEKSNIAPSPSFNIQTATVVRGSSRPIPQTVQSSAKGKNQTAIVVTQKADTITIERKNDVNDRTASYTEVYTLNGKENMLGSGRNTGIATVTFSPDGKILTIATTRTAINDNQETHQWKTTQVWRLTDSNTLSIVKSLKTTKETTDSLVYDRM